MTSLAVVIPTRDRGATAADAARAVLRDPSDFELVVVDQSANNDTENALRLVRDSRLTVIRSTMRGISNARNAGVSATSADIIAFTDDDCRPEPGWASALNRVFSDDPDAALVFGRVYLPPLAHFLGFAASFEPGRRILEGGVPTPEAGIGIGASFAVRRSILDRLGGFDPLLGVGAPVFHAGEELDLLLRAMHAGYRVVNATECGVLHLGVRTGADIRPLAVNYQIGTGAALAKHARVAGLSGLRDILRWTSYFVSQAVRGSIRRHRSELGAPCYFVAGALMTLRYRLNPIDGMFQTRG
jgi:GT2 family glycosyltransferase